MKSALYEGRVRHQRVGPRRHAFGYRLFLVYLDLDELEATFRGRPLLRRLMRFRRADYLGPAERSLREAVLERVESELGRRPRGAVRMLTHLRTLGYVFNPVTFYYCFEPDGALDAVVAEITNTPWGERHAYVLDARDARDTGEVRARFAKAFHVSPFLDMDLEYDWRFSVPGASLRVDMIDLEHGRPVFDARLECRRRPWTTFELVRALVRHPLLTWRIPAAIYFQAFLLWCKRTPFFVHPAKRVPASDLSS